MYIGITCLFAISVNVCSYALIGKTSSVTYQVIGHAKTCLILIGGFLVSGSIPTAKNLLGVIVAMVGVILYGHCKSLDTIKTKDRNETPISLNKGKYSHLDAVDEDPPIKPTTKVYSM